MKPRLSISDIEALKRQGLSQSEIARAWGVSRQAVSWHKHQYNGSLTPREVVLLHFPWDVHVPQTQSSPYRRLRDHGEFVATRGKGMSEDKLKRLRAFYQKLRDESLVLEHDPRLPPEPGVSNKGGFAFRPRLPEDEDFLIRINEYTRLTPEGDSIWRFPPVDP